jgi:hypothetical protein
MRRFKLDFIPYSESYLKFSCIHFGSRGRIQEFIQSNLVNPD